MSVRLTDITKVRRRDVAVDLGTANTVVFVRGEGIVLFEPSVVAIDERTGEVYAVGERARRMIGRTPGAIHATRPLRHGVVADFDVTREMLREFLRAAGRARLTQQRVVLCVPSGVTGVERRAVEQAVLAAGAQSAFLIEEALAGAIGAGLAIAEPRGQAIVDVGGGTTEIAVVSLGEIVVSQSLRLGGYDMDDAIVRQLRDDHKLLVGQDKAEEAKIAIGAAHARAVAGEAELAGRDLITGLLRRITVEAADVHAALAAPVAQIVDAVVATLEQTPPDLAADLAHTGITMVGGGSLLHGFDQRLSAETGLRVRVADDALTCVARGAGRSLDELPTLERVAARARPRRRRWRR